MAASPKSSRKIAEFDKQILKWDAICLKNGWKKSILRWPIKNINIT